MSFQKNCSTLPRSLAWPAVGRFKLPVSMTASSPVLSHPQFSRPVQNVSQSARYPLPNFTTFPSSEGQRNSKLPTSVKSFNARLPALQADLQPNRAKPFSYPPLNLPRETEGTRDTCNGKGNKSGGNFSSR